MELKKTVRFSEKIQVFRMHVWKYAYEQARKSSWRQELCDRIRFEARIQETEKMLVPLLKEKIKNLK